MEKAASLFHEMVNLTNFVNHCTASDGVTKRDAIKLRNFHTNKTIEGALKALISTDTNTCDANTIKSIFTSMEPAFTKIKAQDKMNLPLEESIMVRFNQYELDL